MNNTKRIRSVEWLERENAFLSDLILGDAKAWAEDILRTWKLDRSKLRICPLGIDLERVDKVVKVPTEIEQPYVLFAGRLTLAKGPQVLSSAASEILRENPNVKIVFAGADTLTESGQSVREIVRNAAPRSVQDSFVFKGFVDSWDELVNMYRNAEICVKADAYGNHSYDAMGQMSCERPMVCANTEGYADMIENGKNGFLFERERPGQLAGLVNLLLSDSALCRTIGMSARRTIEQRFTSEICATETVKYYKEAMSQSTASV